MKDNNWNNKEYRAKKAAEHARYCAETYPGEIKKSLLGTIEYFPDFKCVQFTGDSPQMTIEPLDSVSAIFKYADFAKDKMAVLNFASYKYPGGMFLQGSSAQEESLCHESFLFNVLKEKKDYYDWNKNYLNNSLYMNRALYTPNVIFERDKQVSCGVITCAAPNLYSGKRYHNITREENAVELSKRIQYIFDIADDNKIETLILGAFGCGVFGQQATEVAEVFKKTLQGRGYGGRKPMTKYVIFAIPEGTNGNLLAFKNVFFG